MWRNFIYALTAAALLCCGPAWGHDAFGNARSVGSGALHLLTSALSITALVGLVVALIGLEDRWLMGAAGIAAAFAAAGAALPGMFPGPVAPACVVVVGLSAAAGLKPAGAVALMLAGCAGLAAGLSTGLDKVTWEPVIGASLTVLLIPVLLLTAIDDVMKFSKVQAVLPIGRRVLGSWVAAIGLLLGALALRGVAA